MGLIVGPNNKDLKNKNDIEMSLAKLLKMLLSEIMNI